MPTNPADFTENKYAIVLRKAAEKYRFNGSDLSGSTPTVCWRHDIDYSPHRALAMAKLEAGLGLRCVYHILPSSRYYNILEPEVTEILRTIVALGHEIGLHFDPDVLRSDAVQRTVLLERVEIERGLLAGILRCDITSLSFHNHTLHHRNIAGDAEFAGMRNLASPRFYEGAAYVSDSNGIWRGRTLDEVIDGPVVPKLHVLTHPLWWTPDPMPPYDRFLRVLSGRYMSARSLYLRTMQRDGRLSAIGTQIGVNREHLCEAGLVDGADGENDGE